MIGEFEKPIYVTFDENLCAHCVTRSAAARDALMLSGRRNYQRGRHSFN